MQIIKNFCPQEKYSTKCPHEMSPVGVCIHNTANDASAKNEVAYMLGNDYKVSYHYAVDDKEIIQAIPNNRNAWHAGDGGSGTGNRKYIGIEICYSKSGGARFEAAMKNAAWLTAQLLKEYGWTIVNVKKHQDFSGKHCPHRILDDYGWDYFLNLVKGKAGSAVIPEVNSEKSPQEKDSSEAKRIVAVARTKIGSKNYYRYNSRKGKFLSYCQAFVADVYAEATGQPRQTKNTAAEAESAWMRSTRTDNIPIGATVYFSGSSGHVGIYVGGGKVVHAWSARGVIESSISTCGKYHGWGFNGDYRPDGAVVDSREEGSPTSEKNAVDVSGAKSSEASETKKLDITSVVVKSTTGAAGARRVSGLRTVAAQTGVGAEVLIQNDKIYAPALVGSINLTYERKNAPGTLTFEVIKDEILNFQEGNPVSFCFNENKIFYGYVFKKERTDNKTIKVTAYDQLRYFKNKDTISYENKTYSQLLKMLADDYGLRCGSLTNTGFVIPSRIEEGTIFDILGNASDTTLAATGKSFVLYDDFGEIQLRDINELFLNYTVHDGNAEKFSYESTIDDKVYNRVKLAVDNDKTGEREVYISQTAESQSSWGVLQYYEKLDADTPDVAKQKADVYLKYYNQKRRSLSVSGCQGSWAVRGGSVVAVGLNLGDVVLNERMMVERVTHILKSGNHTMDLSLKGFGGDFIV